MPARTGARAKAMQQPASQHPLQAIGYQALIHYKQGKTISADHLDKRMGNAYGQ